MGLALVLILLCAVSMLARPVRGQASLAPVPLHDLSAFRASGANWSIAGDVFADLEREGHLERRTGTGILVCLPTEADRSNLFTTWEHGDLALEMDVLMPAGSNSGVYLQGRYEVQFFDSWGVRNPRFGDAGGIYQRWDESRPEGREGFGGVPPRLNASRAPGLWQHLKIDFRAPRFDTLGRKVENARFERVVLNGVTIHENVEVTGPTRAAAFEAEAPTGPLMFQGDHGPVAVRNLRSKRYGTGLVRLSDVTYRLYEGEFTEWPNPEPRTPIRSGPVDGFREDLAEDLETFAVAFTGDVTVPTTGPYRFELAFAWIDEEGEADAARTAGGYLRVGDDYVLEHSGTARVVDGVVELEAGRHGFELAYFKNREDRTADVLLSVEGPDTRRRLLNAETTRSADRPVGSILLEVYGEPVLHRHMFDIGEERRTHVISVGDPQDVHYTFDLRRGALLRTWRGPFLDTTPMWHARGIDQLALPRGSVVRFDGGAAVAPLSDDSAPWPPETPYRFEGYELDDSGRPAFRYDVAGTGVVDRLEPAMEGRALRRTLSVDGDGELTHRISVSDRISPTSDNTFVVGDRSYLVRLDDALRPVLRSSGGRDELLVPLTQDDVSYTIIW